MKSYILFKENQTKRDREYFTDSDGYAILYSKSQALDLLNNIAFSKTQPDGKPASSNMLYGMEPYRDDSPSGSSYRDDSTENQGFSGSTEEPTASRTEGSLTEHAHREGSIKPLNDGDNT